MAVKAPLSMAAVPLACSASAAARPRTATTWRMSSVTLSAAGGSCTRRRPCKPPAVAAAVPAPAAVTVLVAGTASNSSQNEVTCALLTRHTPAMEVTSAGEAGRGTVAG